MYNKILKYSHKLRQKTISSIENQMLACGHFAIYCKSNTQEVPFLSFYLCCYANIITPTVNLRNWSTAWWGWEEQWAKSSFLQIATFPAALDCDSLWAQRQPQCWRRGCKVIQEDPIPSSLLLVTPVVNCAPEHLFSS